MPHEPETGIALGELGLQEAIDRLKERLENLDAHPLVPLAEALHWAYTLEEWHRWKLNAKEPEGPERYFEARFDANTGRVLGGLMYARALVTHRLATVADLVDSGATGTVAMGVATLGGSAAEWRWTTLQALPSPGKPEMNGRDQLYRDHVAGRSLITPLQDAERFLLDEVFDIYPIAGSN